MFYYEMYKQWIYDSDECNQIGENCKKLLLRQDETAITAGTVMVFMLQFRPILMFQTLSEVSLRHIKDVSLIGYEVGSIVFLNEMKIVPTIAFRACRLPTLTEYKFYFNKITV